MGGSRSEEGWGAREHDASRFRTADHRAAIGVFGRSCWLREKPSLIVGRWGATAVSGDGRGLFQRVNMSSSRVVLAMSGGVDSSVAAQLLQEAGHEVVGVFMRHAAETTSACVAESVEDSADAGSGWVAERSDHKQGCCSAADAADARSVAQRLGIPFYALNLQADFGRIKEYFVSEYLAGRTPNPCVVCNTWLKFGRLFDYADQIGADFVATGHYAQCVPVDPGSKGSSSGTMDADHPDRSPSTLGRPGDVVLQRGVDSGKDQSYALFGVPRERLRRMLLPVGSYRKTEIRTRAAALGLIVADKRDSQEICFVDSGHHAEFVRQKKGDRSTDGSIVTTDGRVVGQHDGIERFTVGQRKGLGVALGEPFFVVAVEPDTSRVVIGRKPELARRELTAARCNWLVDRPTDAFACEAQIRYNSRAQPATVTPLPDGRMRVVFDQPCYGVAPGQAVVCYRGPQVLGGGWIESPPSTERGIIGPGKQTGASASD